jgi:hypothetical protein
LARVVKKDRVESDMSSALQITNPCSQKTQLLTLMMK